MSRSAVRAGFGALAAIVLVVAGLWMTAVGAPGGPVDSGDPRATAHSGNIKDGDCAAAGLPGSKIEVGFTITGNTYIDITSVPSGYVLTGVVVKGGPAYNVYAGDVRTDLHAPLVSSGEPAEISHWFACGTPVTTTTSTTSETTTTSEATTTSESTSSETTTSESTTSETTPTTTDSTTTESETTTPTTTESTTTESTTTESETTTPTTTESTTTESTTTESTTTESTTTESTTTTTTESETTTPTTTESTTTQSETTTGGTSASTTTSQAVVNPTTARPAGGLARTGFSVGGFLVAGSVLLLVGAGLIIAIRRRAMRAE